MSGHSRWSKIKHSKEKTDVAKGKLFARHIREITLAARQGGGDPEENSRLRSILERARAANLPGETIARAIARGCGQFEGLSYEELCYEAYGPFGVAMLIEALTDNRNRTTAEIRYVLERNGGQLAETGSVVWKFARQIELEITVQEGREEEIFWLAAEADARDVQLEQDQWLVVSVLESVEPLRSRLKDAGLEIIQEDVVMLPVNALAVPSEEVAGIDRLLARLQELDDVTRATTDLKRK